MMKSAAQSVYPHLPSAERPELAQPMPKIADALWPALKQPTWDERWWAQRRKQERESLLRGLREANANIDARMKRGGK